MNKLSEWLKALPIKDLLDKFDIVSGAVLFIVAINMLGLFWYNAIHGKATDNAAVIWSLGIVGAKTTHGVMTNKQDNDNQNPPN